MAPSVLGHAPSGEGQHTKGQVRRRLRNFLGDGGKQPANNKSTALASSSRPGLSPSEKLQPQQPHQQPRQQLDEAHSAPKLLDSATQATTKDTPKRDLWQEAFDKLPERTQNKLNAGGAQKLTLRSHVAELLELSRKRQKECEGEAWKFHLGDREVVVRDYAASIVEGVKKVGDVAINLAPPQASYAWSAFKMLLQIAVVDAEQMGALLVSVDKMLRVLNRSQVFESEYSAQNTSALAFQNLQAALVDLNGAILELLADSSELLRKNTARQILHAVSHPGKTAGLFATLDELEDKLCRDVQACQSEQVSAILTRIEGKEGLETLEWISSVPFGTHHNSVADARLPDTCSWLLEHETYRTWEGSTSSAMLWLCGSAGTGKTFLASRVVDHVKRSVLSSPYDEGFAYFYCYRIEESRRRPLSILQSYVRQLSTTAKHPDNIRKSLRDLCAERRRQDASNLSFEDCRKQLLESIQLYPKTTLVLDGLDECDSDGHGEGLCKPPDTRERLMETIYYLLSEAKRPLKVFVSSRSDRDIWRRFRGQPSIEIEARQNREDIRRYVNKEIARHENWGTMPPALCEEIITVLLDRSQNMFLWAYYQIGQILALESTEAIVDRLGKLPNGLEKTYDELYGKIRVRNKYDRALADRAFMVVMNARRPIASEELLLLIRADPDQSMAAPFVRPITDTQLLHLCNNLLLLDSASKVWRLSHVSVMEYLNDKVHSLEEARLKTVLMAGKLFYAGCVNSKIMLPGHLDSDPDAGSSPTGKPDIPQSPSVDLVAVVFVFDAFNTDVAFEMLLKVGRMFVAQSNYKGAEQLIWAIWSHRTVQRWKKDTVISVGSMVVHASIASGQVYRAISFCEAVEYNLRRSLGSLDPTVLEWTKLLLSLYLYNNKPAMAEAIRERVGRQIKDSLEYEASEDNVRIDTEYALQSYRGKSNPLDGVVAYVLPSGLKLETNDDLAAGDRAKPAVGLQTEPATALQTELVTALQTEPMTALQTLSASLRKRRIAGLVLCCVVLCVAIVMTRVLMYF